MTHGSDNSGWGTLAIPLAAIAALLSIGLSAQLNDPDDPGPQPTHAVVAAIKSETAVAQIHKGPHTGSTPDKRIFSCTVGGGGERSNVDLTVPLQCRDRQTGRTMSSKVMASESSTPAKKVVVGCTSNTFSRSPLPRPGKPGCSSPTPDLAARPPLQTQRSPIGSHTRRR
jgi:hypothetical protein